MSWDSRRRHAKPDKVLAKMMGESAEVENYQMEKSLVQSRDVRIGLTRAMVAAASHSTISLRSGKRVNWWVNLADSQSASLAIVITRRKRKTTSERIGNQRFRNLSTLKVMMCNNSLAKLIPK
jgi:hypothetical protein|tara:strand:- start:330 stop:698 length:369 start_codon:yes stop_codon:yes gene_type:complete